MGDTKLTILAAKYNIVLTKQMVDQFTLYGEVLTEWNQRMNLTAITDPDEVAVKHFLDSLLVLNALETPHNSSIIDVGTGAGFPAIPLKIARNDLQVTLLDSLNKRVAFLTHLSQVLGQDNRVIHGRAEECGKQQDMREKFFLATARAVAALPALCEYCLPFVQPGGFFAALKGGEIAEEVDAASMAIRLLGGELSSIKEYILPDSSRRTIIIIKKSRHTPAKYPRSSVKITKSPL